MIAACDHKFHVGKPLRGLVKGVDHEFELLIGPPLSECQDAVKGVSAPGEIGIFGAVRQDAMCPKMHILAAILLEQKLTIMRHEDRYGVRHEDHSCSHAARESIGARKADSQILEVQCIHEVMQGDMSVFSAQAREKRESETGESIQRIAAKCAEEQVEPNHVGLEFAKLRQQTNDGRGTVGRPATNYIEPFKLGGGG